MCSESLNSPLVVRGEIGCPHCEAMLDIAIILHDRQLSILNPVGEETMEGLVREWIAQRAIQSIHESQWPGRVS